MRNTVCRAYWHYHWWRQDRRRRRFLRRYGRWLP